MIENYSKLVPYRSISFLFYGLRFENYNLDKAYLKTAKIALNCVDRCFIYDIAQLIK